MKEFIFYSPYDALVKYGEKEAFLKEGQSLSIFPLSKVFIFPVGKFGKISFSLDINNLKENQFFHFTQKDNKILVFLLDGTLVEDGQIFKVVSKGKTIEVEIKSHSVRFFDGQKFKTLHFDQKVKSAKCESKNEFVLCQCFCQDTQTLLIFNPTDFGIKIFKASNISLTSNGFKLEENQNCFFKTLEKEYIYEGNNVKLLSLSCQENLISQRLLPYKFMVFLKEKNFDLASGILSEDLKKSITSDGLKQIFEKLTYFYFLSDSSCYALIDGQNKILSFMISNSCICDIDGL